MGGYSVNNKIKNLFVKFASISDRKFKTLRRKKDDLKEPEYIDVIVDDQHIIVEDLLDSDALNSEEAGFLHGYIGE